MLSSLSATSSRAVMFSGSSQRISSSNARASVFSPAIFSSSACASLSIMDDECACAISNDVKNVEERAYDTVRSANNRETDNGADHEIFPFLEEILLAA